MVGVNIPMLLFMYPETKYQRVHSDEINTDSATTESRRPSSTTEERFENSLKQQSSDDQDHHLSKGSPSRAQWHLWQSNARSFTSLWLNFWTPWKLFAFPIVEFASFVVSWCASCFLVINLTQSQVFMAPPYNFSAQTIGKNSLASTISPLTIPGFFNFAIVVGAIIGLVTAGPMSDYISARATRLNKGIREPEMRLPAMIPFFFTMILGNVVLAVGYQRGWPWEAIVIIGFACGGLTATSLTTIVSTYAVDSYKPVAGSLFVSITVNKNVWGYGVSRFVTPWTMEAGYLTPILVNMALTSMFCLFGILFYFKGKTFRRWSQNSKVHLM